MQTWSWKDTIPVGFVYGHGAYGYGYYGSSGSGYLPAPEQDTISAVGSFSADYEPYEKKSNISEVESDEETFYFDPINQIIYIHFTGTTTPWDYTYLNLGITKGFSNHPVVINNLKYESRLMNVPDLEIERDPFFFGITSFEGGKITLLNTDGGLDSMDQEKVFGQPVRVKYINENQNYTTIYSGNYESHEIKGNNFDIKIADKRKLLTLSIPNNLYGSETIDKFENTPIPVVWGGYVSGGGQAAHIGSGTFQFADPNIVTVDSVDQVYQNGELKTYSGGDFTYDLAAATITFTGTWDSEDTVFVVFRGNQSINNPADVIKALLMQYLEIPFTDDYFDITEWNTVTTFVDNYTVSLYIKEPIKLIDAIGKVGGSAFLSLIINSEGKYSLKVVDKDKASIMSLSKIDYMKSPSLKYLSKEYASSVRIEYGKNHRTGNIKTVVDTTQEDELFQEYVTYKEQKFETLHTTSGDANEFATKSMSLYGGIFQTWEIETAMQTVELELEDLIDCELYEDPDGNKYSITLEVLGKKMDLINGRITITGRAISINNNIPKNAHIIRI